MMRETNNSLQQNCRLIEQMIEKKQYKEALNKLKLFLKGRTLEKIPAEYYLRLLIMLGEVLQKEPHNEYQSQLAKLLLTSFRLAEQLGLSDAMVLIAVQLTQYYIEQFTAFDQDFDNIKNPYGHFALCGQQDHVLGNKNSVIFQQFQHYEAVIFFAQKGLSQLDDNDTQKQQPLILALEQTYVQVLFAVTIEWREERLKRSIDALRSCSSIEEWEIANVYHQQELTRFIHFIEALAEHEPLPKSLTHQAQKALYLYYEGLEDKIVNLPVQTEFTMNIQKLLLPTVFKKLQELANNLFIRKPQTDCLFSQDSYRKQLKNARDEIKKNIQLGKDLTQCQQTLSEKMKTILASMWDDICKLLQAPELKEKVCLLVLGSLSRGDSAPYSDIEYALLIKDEQAETCWLARMALQYFDLLVMNCGESCLKHYKLLQVGFRIDQGPWSIEDLCDTPLKLANYCFSIDLRDNNEALASSLLFSIPIWGKASLYNTTYCNEINRRLSENTQNRDWALCRIDHNRALYLAEVQNEKQALLISSLSAGLTDIKSRYLKWLTYLAMDLAFFYRLSDTHPLMVIATLQKRHLITKAFASNYSRCYSAIVKHRIKRHCDKQFQCDESRLDEFPELKRICDEAERLLLRPYIKAQEEMLAEEKLKNLNKLLCFDEQSATFGMVKLLHRMCWEFSLQRLTTAQEPISTLAIKIESSHFEKPRYLHSALIEEVIDIKTGLLREDKNTEHGRRLVIPIVFEGQIIAYFKFFPELAGSEFAVSRLQELLFGDVYPRILLAKFTVTIDSKEIIYPVLISEAMLGDNLQDCFEKNKNYALPKNINLKDYTREALLALVTFQGDGKPDGHVLVPSPQESDDEKTLCIRVIDKEQSFLGSALDKSGKLQLNSLLFCMKQMEQLPDKTVLAHFATQDALKVFGQWLKDCQAYNQAQVKLFGKELIVQWHNPDRNFLQKLWQKVSQDDHSIFSNILFPFGDEGAKQIYRRLTKLQIAAKQPESTFYDLLHTVSQRAYCLYKSVNENLPLYEHYLALGKAEFNNLVNTNKLFTKLRGLQRIETLPLSSKVENAHYDIHQLIEGKEFSPQQGLEWFKQIKDVIARQFKSITEDLMRGEINSARQKLKNVQACLWPQIASFLHFKTIKGDSKRQTEWLNLIFDRDCEQVDLSDCEVLSKQYLALLVKKHKMTVERLNISSCSGLQLDVIKELAAMEHLAVLNVSHIEKKPESSEIIHLPTKLNLSKPLLSFGHYFPALRRLLLNDNVFLTELTIAIPSFEELDVTGCTSLRTLHLSGCTRLTVLRADTAIDTLDLSNNKDMTEQQLTVLLADVKSARDLNVNGCPKIQDGYFETKHIFFNADKTTFTKIPQDDELRHTAYKQIQGQFISKDFDYLFKILLAGDSDVGKSCFMRRFADDYYANNFMSTTGVDFKIKIININEIKCKLQIWDTSGNRRFGTIISSYYRGVAFILLAFDITDRESFKSVKEYWVDEIDKHATAPILLVGMKADLSDKRVVSCEEGHKLANEISAVDYIECSSKDGTNVEDAMNIMARSLVEKNKKNEEKSLSWPHLPLEARIKFYYKQLDNSDPLGFIKAIVELIKLDNITEKLIHKLILFLEFDGSAKNLLCQLVTKENQKTIDRYFDKLKQQKCEIRQRIMLILTSAKLFENELAELMVLEFLADRTVNHKASIMTLNDFPSKEKLVLACDKYYNHPEINVRQGAAKILMELSILHFKTIKGDLKRQAEWLSLIFDSECEQLDLSDCEVLSKQYLALLVKKHKMTVERLNVSSCSGLQLDVIKELATMEHLAVLNVSHIEKLPESSEIIHLPTKLNLSKPLLSFGHYFPALRRLILNDNVFLTELTIAIPSLEELDVTGCSSLHTLRLSGCTRLTVLRADTAIDTLDLSNNKDMTEQQLTVLLAQVKSVRDLNVNGCPKIQDGYFETKHIFFNAGEIAFAKNSKDERLRYTVYKQIQKRLISKDFDYFFKIILVGDMNVGKSLFLLKFADDTYTEHFIATIGVDFKIKIVDVNGIKCKLQIWDTSGTRRFGTIRHSYYRGVAFILLAFDITNRESFEEVKEYWVDEIDKHATAPILLVGMKADLSDKRVVSCEEGHKLADEISAVDYIECSSKNGANVEEAINIMVRSLVEQIKKDDEEESLSWLDLPLETRIKFYYKQLDNSDPLSFIKAIVELIKLEAITEKLIHKLILLLEFDDSAKFLLTQLMSEKNQKTIDRYFEKLKQQKCQIRQKIMLILTSVKLFENELAELMVLEFLDNRTVNHKASITLSNFPSKEKLVLACGKYYNHPEINVRQSAAKILMELSILHFKTIKGDLKRQAEWLHLIIDSDCEQVDLSDCEVLSKQYLALLVKKHKMTVERLDVSNCSGLRLDVIKELAAMEHLAVLNVSHLEKKPESSEIIHLPTKLNLSKPRLSFDNYFPALRRLLLNDNVFLTELTIAIPSLEELDVTGCTSLHTLRLSGCTRLTVLRADTAIDTLDLSNNKDMTEQALTLLLAQVKSVRDLNVNGCPKIQDGYFETKHIFFNADKTAFTEISQDDELRYTVYRQIQEQLTAKDYCYLFKILLVGDSGVGKSIFLSKFTDDLYSDRSAVTSGADFKIKTADINGIKCKLQIWDMAGLTMLRPIARSYYRGAHFILLAFDITDRGSFESVKEYWIDDINNTHATAPILLVGMKADLSDKRVVSYEEGHKLANEISAVDYIECSSKDGANVEEAMNIMPRSSVEKIKKNEEESLSWPHLPLEARIKFYYKQLDNSDPLGFIKAIVELIKLEAITEKLIHKLILFLEFNYSAKPLLIQLISEKNQKTIACYFDKLKHQKSEIRERIILILRKLKSFENEPTGLNGDKLNKKLEITIIAEAPAFHTKHFNFTNKHSAPIFSFFDNKTLVKTAPLVNKAWYLLSQKEIERRKINNPNFFKTLFAPSHKPSDEDEENNNNHSSQQQNQDIDKKTL